MAIEKKVRSTASCHNPMIRSAKCMYHHPFHLPATHDRSLEHIVCKDVIEWLVWNDRNGIYSDEACEIEGLDKLTLESAKELMKSFISNRQSLDLN